MNNSQTYALRLPTRTVAVVVDETKDSVTVTMRYTEDENSDPKEKEGFMKWLMPLLRKHVVANKRMILSVPQRGIFETMFIPP